MSLNKHTIQVFKINNKISRLFAGLNGMTGSKNVPMNGGFWTMLCFTKSTKKAWL